MRHSSPTTLPSRSSREPLRAVPDRSRGDAAHGLPSVWSIGVAVAPITAVVVVPMIVAVVAVMVMAAMGVPLMALTMALTVAFPFALTPNLHDVVRARELRQD